MSDLSRVEQLLRNALGEDIYEVTPQSRVETLLVELNELIEGIGGSVSPEDIATAVAAYLDEHLTNPTNPPVDTSLTIAGAAADSKKTGDEIEDLKSGFSDIEERVEALEEGGTGISDNAIDLLDQLGSHIAFTSAQGGQLWDDLIDELRNSTPSVMYTVAWTGSNYSSSNSATSVRDGRPYITTISPNEGYVISAVTASMGNSAVTPTDNGDGTYTISIASVTANISINVSTAIGTGDILFQITDRTFDGTDEQTINTGLKFGSMDANGITSDWTFTFNGKSNATGSAWFGIAFDSGLANGISLKDDVSAKIIILGVNKTTNAKLRDAYVPIVIAHKANKTNELTLYTWQNGAMAKETVTTDNVAFDLHGAYFTEMAINKKGTYNYYFNGHIKDCTVYTKILTDNEINTYFTEAMA